MHKTNLRSLDLNLLVALKALLDEKHVTRAANRIGLSQPAMSRALGRLRVLFKDPLLVTSGNGSGLTARAMEIQQPLQVIFAEIHQLMSPPSLDPASMQGEISIATRDNEMVSILPQVISKVTQEAPGLTLRVQSMVGDDLSPLEDHRVDFILTGTKSKSANLCYYTLYEEDFVCLAAANNPAAQQELTLENFLGMKHCLVSITGFGPGYVDTVLAKQRLQRKIVVYVPHFLAAAYIVSRSDLLVTVPRNIGLLLTQSAGSPVVMLQPPIKIPHYSIYLYWHIRNQNNLTHKWLRDVIRNNAQPKMYPQIA